MSPTKSVCVAALLSLAALTPPAASAQTLVWTEASTLGYGATAGSLALAACWSGCSLESAGVLLLASGVAGLVAGNRIGASAERAARAGRLSPGRRWAARFGTVTGFAAAGTLLSAWWINEREGNAPGEDERRLFQWTSIGAAAGVVAQLLQEHALGDRADAALASAFVRRGSSGGIAVGLRIPTPSW